MLQVHFGPKQLFLIRNKFRFRQGQINIAKFRQLHHFAGFAAICYRDGLFFFALVVVVNIHKYPLQNFTLHFQLHFLLHFKGVGIALFNIVIGILFVFLGRHRKTQHIPAGQRNTGTVKRQR